MSGTALVSRLVVRNYKSIAECDVALGPLTFLVGPNGSGKSNFLDALGFVADALRHDLDYAVERRGGIGQVRRRVSRQQLPMRYAGGPVVGAPEELERIGIGLEYTLPSGISGTYSLKIDTGVLHGYVVDEERCVVRDPADPAREHSFEVHDGSVLSSISVVPAASADRLYLVSASGLPEFRPVYDALSRMVFYDLSPARIAAVQPTTRGDSLDSDGGNIASVVCRLEREDRVSFDRIREYMAALLPGFEGILVSDLDPGQRLDLAQHLAEYAPPMRFPAASMSDGTLRALGILVALFQPSNGAVPSARLVGIEEPETALHPAALGVLLDALREASNRRQILVTSHSSDLLDDKDVDPDSILAVHWESGQTRVAPLGEVGRGILRDRLSTVGELLRTGQLEHGSSVISERAALSGSGARDTNP